MKILVIDDEYLAVENLVEVIKEIDPFADIYPFTSAKSLLSFAENNLCDIAFMETKMSDMHGISLAKKLKNINPVINIIFVTSHPEFKGDAMDLRASGYVSKPIYPEKIKDEFENLRYPIISKKNHSLLKVNCFGNFDVFSTDSTPVHFERAKSKEALAYLVYLKGSSCSVAELSTVLFENDNFSDTGLDYTRRIISSLKNSLSKINAEKIIVKQHNSIAINTSLVDCDYYKLLQGDEDAALKFTGEFMYQYSWAEPTAAWIQNKIR